MSISTLEHPARAGVGRLVSLDVLRGATIAFMILVNNSGDRAYWPLQHSDWNGWTPTDLVFPIFLFLMGASIVFSFEARLSRGELRRSLAAHTVKRFVILFLLGLVVNGFPFFHLETLRIYGVLQRIAICFLVCGLFYLADRRAASKVATIVLLLLGYWILLRWIPVPGYGYPVRNIPFLDKDANLVAYVDRHLFPGRLYEGTRDPEGLLSTLPAIATALMGMLAGMWLRSSRSPERKCAGMLAAGVLCMLVGEIWNPWFPINKKLWTSSFVILTAGVALVAWAVCYWAVEIKGWTRGWTYFWLVFGKNAIAAYVFSELLAASVWEVHLPGRRSLSQIAESHLNRAVHPLAIASLIYATVFVLVCWIPLLGLYRRKIFLKV
ncbi:MAG TPA: heparan-alpha-glucosaminide N-acetyltransferase domain-containing protein [Acidobacteriaceae bacterium]|nr:heparan-alpha-glucosaminide N-acetyltransferase domain-containing protein [Acidobacteriaceae bacterium]